MLFRSIGGAIGAAAGKAIEDRNVEEEIVEEKLDDATGVTSPNLGAAKPGAPPPRRGTFSAASSGAQPVDLPPTEGDIVPPEREDT